jgi:hypothetical protein
MTTRMKLKDFKGGLFDGKRPKALTPSESSISKAIRDFLDARRIYNDRLNSGKIFSVTKYFEKKSGREKEFSRWIYLCKPGTPDRFFIVAGKIYLVEVKVLGKTPKPDQIERHKELRAAGATIIVADSFDSFVTQFNRLFAGS